MRVVFAGTPEVAVPALDAIAASRHELVGVVTRPDAPSGRGRKLVASPVAVRAEELGVPVLKPEHPRDPDFQAALAKLRCIDALQSNVMAVVSGSQTVTIDHPHIAGDVVSRQKFHHAQRQHGQGNNHQGVEARAP